MKHPRPESFWEAVLLIGGVVLMLGILALAMWGPRHKKACCHQGRHTEDAR